MEYREYRVIVRDRRSVTGYKQNGPPISGEIYMDDLRERTIGIFSHWLAENKAKQREEFIVLGSHLYEALFGDANSEIRHAFEEEFRKSQRKYPFAPLRLVLEFAREARDLAELPWEYLYYPDGQGRGFFIAAHAELILARHVPIDIDLDLLNIGKGPLRILVVVSKPQYEEVQEEEEDKLPETRKLGSIVADPVITTILGINTIKTSILEQPTKSSLTRRINTFKPNVVHFIAHGRYKEQKGELALVDKEDPRLADWIDDAGFADCFMRYKPGLIFLHACEGARSKSYQIFKGLALQLIYSEIPAVVAMQYAVENGVANHFATTFYQSLSEGKAIDIAVQEGRRELGDSVRPSYSNRSFGCPVIYLQRCSTEIVLVRAQEQQEQQVQREPLTISTIVGQCPDCGAQNAINNKYCRNCRQALIICPKCASLVTADSHCCSECGNAVEPGAVGARVGAKESILTYAMKPEPVDAGAVRPEPIGAEMDTNASVPASAR